MLGSVLHMNEPMQSLILSSEKYTYLYLLILQIRNLRPMKKCQMFIQGHSAPTYAPTYVTGTVYPQKSTNFNGSIPPASFAKYTFYLYIVNFHSICCFAGVPMNRVCISQLRDWMGILKGRPYIPISSDMLFSPFSVPCHSVQRPYLHNTGPLSQGCLSGIYHSLSRR